MCITYVIPSEERGCLSLVNIRVCISGKSSCSMAYSRIRERAVCVCVETALTTLHKSCSWPSCTIVQQQLKSSQFAVVLFQVSVQHVVLLITMLINKLEPQKQFSPLHCFLCVSEIERGLKYSSSCASLPFPAFQNPFLCEVPSCQPRKCSFICSCFMCLSSRLLVKSGNIHTVCAAL